MIKEQKAIRKYNINSPAQAMKMANVLKEYVVRNKLYAKIRDKNYVMVEGWQFAGGLIGLTPNIIGVKDLTSVGTKNYKWFAEAEIIRNKDDKKVGSGFALCSKEETKKKNFDEFAILSMAQTRAIGKAFRNKIGWIMKLAGYEPTPAEEMRNVSEANYTEVSDDFEKSKTMITNSKTKDGLFGMLEVIKKSKKYSKAQKKELETLISTKIDKL